MTTKTCQLRKCVMPPSSQRILVHVSMAFSDTLTRMDLRNLNFYSPLLCSLIN